MKKALILHSGGLDSTVCLLQAKEQGFEVISLGIDYNQKHSIETQYAFAQCKSLDIERKLIKINWDKPYKKIPTGRSITEIRSGISSAFLQGRNILFLSIACAEAAGIGASQVWIGINSIDFSGYPDCTPQFIDSYINMMKQGFPGGPKIKTPLLNMTKPQIAEEAYRLGILRGDTWSCYNPKININGVEPCHECDACKLHDFAWSKVKTYSNRRKSVFNKLSFR